MLPLHQYRIYSTIVVLTSCRLLNPVNGNFSALWQFKYDDGQLSLSNSYNPFSRQSSLPATFYPTKCNQNKRIVSSPLPRQIFPLRGIWNLPYHRSSYEFYAASPKCTSVRTIRSFPPILFWWN